MKRLALLLVIVAAILAASWVAGFTIDATAHASSIRGVVEDGGGGGSVTPCNASTYGTSAVFYNYVYGTRLHVCRYAGGYVYWGSAIQSYVYAGGNPVSGNWGYAEWTCNINPYYCYVYAYVPA